MSSSKITALIDIECESQRAFGFDQIAMRIARFPQVLDVHVVSGRSDLTIKIEAENIHEISKFVTETLAPMEGVRSTATNFYMKEYKQDGVLTQAESKPSRLPISA